MPPGSPRALVLPGAAALEIDPDAGTRLSSDLEQFLDARVFSAVAVVHGEGRWAAPAFDRTKRRANDTQGVVWLTRADLLPHLTGAHAETLRRLLTPRAGHLVTFFSVKDRAITGALRWSELSPEEIDPEFNRADRGAGGQ